MKNSRKRESTVVAIICLAALTSWAYAQDTGAPSKTYEGEAQFRYDWIGVNGDEGRFREDNWMTDGSTGGLDWLRMRSTEPDESGYEWVLEARALHDVDYAMSLLMNKPENHYLKLDFSGLRRYFDGSNEFWQPSGVNLAELPDSEVFVDRRNSTIELGLTPSEGLQWIGGWHRLEKDGKEVLLHGRKADDDSDLLSIPTVLNARGVTDTLYAEVSSTCAEIYNFRIRQEFEQYHSNRFQDWQAMNSAGVVDIGDGDISDDHLGYTNWRTMIMIDSFLDEQTYVTANYMYNYLNSNSSYNDPLPTTDSHFYKPLSGNIHKKTNVSGLGYRKAAFLHVPHLDLSVGARVEDSQTSGRSQLQGRTPANALLTTESALDEVRIAESLRLIYKGLRRTTLSFDADLEQRYLTWDADYTDTSSASSSANNLDRKADTDFFDQIYTFKAVRRLNRSVKSTVKFRIKDLERSLTNLSRGNANLNDYPGWLGNWRRVGQDLTVKTDLRINSKTSSTLMYQYVHETIDFTLGGKTTDQEIHRGLGSLSLNPRNNMFLVGSFMLANYTLNTPTNEPSTFGSRPFDFRGNSYSLLLDGIIAFNNKTSCTLDLRHTEAMGTVDFGGDYAFDKLGLTLKRQLASNRAVSLGYSLYSFNNHDFGAFDDYLAHGGFVTYSCSF